MFTSEQVALSSPLYLMERKEHFWAELTCPGLGQFYSLAERDGMCPERSDFSPWIGEEVGRTTWVWKYPT